jgi:hypothetical protein
MLAALLGPGLVGLGRRRGRSEPARAHPRLHVHWFRWVGDDAFGGGSLYACRCGVVRPAF